MSSTGSVKKTAVQKPLQLGPETIRAGERKTIDVPLARLPIHADVTLPLHVVHGRRPGPRLFVCGAIHGDEVNGVEIVHRLLRVRAISRIRGTLIAVPIVNVFGFLANSRYLPDRRDLNRCFPGSEKGSLAGRLAHVFMQTVVADSTHGIDLHTAAGNRCNLPQIRACLDDPETLRLARAFGAPVILDARVRDGSLRAAVRERGVPMLLYEAGEALRFGELAIRAGVRGILSTMRAIGMLPPARPVKRRVAESVICRSSSWVRAPEGGILRSTVSLGQAVATDELLGVISDPFGERHCEVHARESGIVVGTQLLPIVNEGDALFHVAHLTDSGQHEIDLDDLHADLGQHGPLADPDD